MKKIGEIIGYQSKPFLKGGDIQKQQEAFERGKRMFKENRVPKTADPIIFWVKKIVSQSQWNSYYSQNSSYCPLQKDKDGMWVGFLVVNKIPRECFELSDNELLQIDDYRKAYNISPRPLTDLSV